MAAAFECVVLIRIQSLWLNLGMDGHFEETVPRLFADGDGEIAEKAAEWLIGRFLCDALVADAMAADYLSRFRVEAETVNHRQGSQDGNQHEGEMKVGRGGSAACVSIEL